MFPERGLVLISGKDSQTAESSGTGKTSIFLGIAYALNILPTGTTAASLQSWLTDDKMQVELGFVDGSVIRRGRENSFTTNEVKVSGAKAVKEALDKYIGSDSEILQALTYRSQSRPNSFVGMEPASKLEFLAGILGLGPIESAVEAAKKKVSELGVQVDTIKRMIPQIPLKPEKPELNIKELQIQQSELIKEESTLLARKSTIDHFAVSAQNAAVEHHKGKVAFQKAELEKASKFLSVKEMAYRKEVQEAQLKLNAKTAEVRRLRQIASSVDRLTKEKITIESQILVLSKGTCPLCMQDIHDKFAEQTLSTRLGDILQQLAQIPADLNDTIVKLDSEIESFQLPTGDPLVEKLKEIVFVANTNVKDAEKELTGVLKQPLESYSPELARFSQEVESLNNKIKDLETQIQLQKQLYKTYAFSEEQYLRAVEAATRYEQQLRKTEEDLQVEKDFVLAFGKEGFLGSIVEDVLLEIADECNSILRRLSNVNTVTVSFSTDTENGKKKIETWVDVRGVRTRIEDGCSGGMITSITQAVDFAVIKVVGRRTGTSPKWLCLDEVFNGQGTVTKESALEILSELGQDGLVMVIDHGTEFQEYFSQTISVRFENGESQIVN